MKVPEMRKQQCLDGRIQGLKLSDATRTVGPGGETVGTRNLEDDERVGLMKPGTVRASKGCCSFVSGIVRRIGAVDAACITLELAC